MRVTASIRSAMRWSSSSIVLLVVAATACTTTSKFYIPTEGEPRLTTNALRDQSDELVKLQCPRLLNGGSTAMGEARIIVEFDRSGEVQKSRVTRSSGDQPMDDIFGALTARLKGDPPDGMKGDRVEHPVYIGYSCSPQTGATTLNMSGRENPPPPQPPPPLPVIIPPPEHDRRS